MTHEAKYMSPDDAVKLIKNGDRIYIQGSASIPEVLIDALTRRGHELRDVTLYQTFAIHKREAPYCRPEFRDSFFVEAFFVSGSVRRWINEGYGCTIPRFLSQVPELIRDGTTPVDVVLLNCSMPNDEGYVSFGVSGDITISAVECAKVRIAQINPHMPFSYGDPVIHISQLDAAVEVNDELVELPTGEPTAADTAVGSHIAELIPDGACIQIGVGGIPNAVTRALMDHKHLGIHTEAVTDGMLPLLRSGVVDNSQKVVMPGKSVATLALGSRALYDYMDYNEDLIFRDVAWTNDPFIIAQNPKMVSINSCLEIDLTGQICSDSIGEMQYSGVGGQLDFVTGASRSKGGQSFIAMLSTTNKGMSKIKPVLTPGAGVVTTRFHSHYVATEYGVANLRGKNMAERARMLINIAHPDHREELEEAACKRFGYAFLRTAPSLITVE